MALIVSALDCFSEDTLEPLTRSVVALLSSKHPARGRDESATSTGSTGVALVVYKSRLPAREAAFFSACRGLGLQVWGPFGDESTSPTGNSSGDDLGSAAVAGEGTGRALVFGLRLSTLKSE